MSNSTRRQLTVLLLLMRVDFNGSRHNVQEADDITADPRFPILRRPFMRSVLEI